MTVSSETNRVSYIGSGTFGPFSIPFYFLENDDLLVLKETISTGAIVTLAINTDYTISGAGDPNGGSLTLTAGHGVLQNTHNIHIIRDPDKLQGTDYTEYDKFPANSHERALDKITMLIQRVYDVIRRAMKVPDSVTVDQTISDVDWKNRAERYIGYDAAGNLTLRQLSNVQPVYDIQSTYVAVVGGTANAITLSPSPAITSYAAGQRFSFVAASTNTGAVTVNVSGLGAKNLYKNGSQQLVANEITINSLNVIEFDGTNFQLISSTIERRASIASNFASLLADVTKPDKVRWSGRNVQARSSNVILTRDNMELVVIVTGSYTQTFDPAANLGNGWYVTFIVQSGATLTLDPNGAEQVDGATTKDIVGPASGRVHCNGSALYTEGFNGGKETIWIPAAAMTPRLSAGPTFAQIETATNRINLKVLEFPESGTTYAQFHVCMPKSYDGGTVTARFHWTFSSGSGGNIFWQVRGVALRNGVALDTAWGTPRGIAQTLGTAGALHITAETPVITIGNSPAPRDLVVFEFLRNPAHANDTTTVTGQLIGVEIIYNTVRRNDD